MMAFDPVSAIFGVANQVIARVWPDPADQAKAAQALAELQQKGDLAFLDADVQLMTGQMRINEKEAEHGGLFKGGWRPFIGWSCGFALAYKFLIMPVVFSAVQIIAYYTGSEPFPLELLPDLDWQALSVPLLGMLGLGTQRSFEKTRTPK
jgi:hypothetical protein